jgi:uncharacterized protein (TIGR02246 family)
VEVEVELWELEARESIRATMAAYNAAGDRGRPEGLAACFAADGVLDGPGGAIEGRAAIEAEIQGIIERGSAGAARKFVHHHVSSIDIYELTPQAARVRCYYAVLTDQGLDHWGRYEDQLVPVDGRWLFAYRRARTDGFVPGSWYESTNQGA